MVVCLVPGSGSETLVEQEQTILDITAKNKDNQHLSHAMSYKLLDVVKYIVGRNVIYKNVLY